MTNEEKETARFFASVDLFRGMSDAELADVVSMVRPFYRPAGEALFRQGEASDGMYIIARGAVDIRARVPGDAEVTLARLDAGDLLGEVSLLDRGVRSATAVAAEATRGYWFGRRHFEYLRRDMKPASLTLMRRLVAHTCVSVRRSYDRIAAPRGRASAHQGPSAAIPRRPGDVTVPFGALPFFSRLSPEALADVLERSRLFEVERGARLFAQGDDAAEVYFVLRGAARTVLDRAGEPFSIAVHAPGAVVGLVGALDGGSYGASGLAAERSLLLGVSRDVFEALRTEAKPGAFHLNEHLHECLVRVLRRCTDHASRLELETHLNRERGGAHV